MMELCLFKASGSPMRVWSCRWSGREDVPTEFGTRHRAALGLAEASDALVLVASEEGGRWW